MNIKKYMYAELREKAISPEATQEDLSNLAEWLDRCADSKTDWNGECWDIEDGLSLYPLYAEIGQDEYEIVGYEIR